MMSVLSVRLKISHSSVQSFTNVEELNVWPRSLRTWSKCAGLDIIVVLRASLSMEAEKSVRDPKIGSLDLHV